MTTDSRTKDHRAEVSPLAAAASPQGTGGSFACATRGQLSDRFQTRLFKEPELRKYFPSSESVNSTLRSLIKLIPSQPSGRKPQS